MKNTIIAILVTIGFFVVLHLACGEKALVVPNYAHGTVICGAETIIINLGHQNDPEIKELFALADTCPKK